MSSNLKLHVNVDAAAGAVVTDDPWTEKDVGCGGTKAHDDAARDDVVSQSDDELKGFGEAHFRGGSVHHTRRRRALQRVVLFGSFKVSSEDTDEQDTRNVLDL